MLRQITVPIATDGSGNFTTVSEGVNERVGLLHAVYITKGTLADTAVVTLTDLATGQAILTSPAVTASVLYQPRLPTHTAAGVVVSGVVDRPAIAFGGFSIAVATGGNSKAGSVLITIDDGAQAV